MGLSADIGTHNTHNKATEHAEIEKKKSCRRKVELMCYVLNGHISDQPASATTGMYTCKYGSM